MLSRIPTAPDIVAFRLSGTLEQADVDIAIQLVDEALKDNEEVHLFSEVADLEGVSAEAWHDSISRGAHLLTQLKRFGRIAIVSKHAWIRAMARIESALLPHVSYEVFTPEERDRALAWVKGEERRPRAPGFHRLSTGDAHILAFEVDGKIEREEIQDFIGVLEAAVASDQPIRVLGRIKDLRGFDPALLADRRYLELKLKLARHIERYAIVGGPTWLRSLVMTLDPLVRTDMRHFDADEEDEAWRWLKGGIAANPEQIDKAIAG